MVRRPQKSDKRPAKPKKKHGHKKHASHKHDAHKRGGVPSITALVITEITDDEVIGVPIPWDEKRKPPHIVVIESGRGNAVVVGDRVLAKLTRVKPHLYQALVIKNLPKAEAKLVLGLFVATREGGLIESISRKDKDSYAVLPSETLGAEHGELVQAMSEPPMGGSRMRYARITQRLGKADAPSAISLIATHMHHLPTLFSPQALEEAEAAETPKMSKDREDLRALPLVTIDGEDARDFDDAVFAEPTEHGHRLVVAIADVSHYVAEGSALDSDAFERGNSVYFPDRVIPMLPERLSNGLCSLMPNEERYCVAVEIFINHAGEMQRYRFMRGLMKSTARLTYEQVEENRAQYTPLYAAYAALSKERSARGALELDLPEIKVVLNAAGEVAALAPRTRLDSHKLIEEFMIAANVAAADYLITQRAGGVFRVHEPPNEDKLEELRQMLKLSGYSLGNGAISVSHLNRVLKKAIGQPEAPMVHQAVLRAQMQAFYAHENTGHFGLGLQRYAHFTSPIRRYADLVVHRGLVDRESWMVNGEKKKKVTTHHPPSTRHLPEVALHISETERKAMLAEREANDRYKIAFMARHVGEVFSGMITGLNEFGVYVTITLGGVNGFVPVRLLGHDFFHFDRKHRCFKGTRSKHIIRAGDPVSVRVEVASSITGSLIFALI